MYRNILISVALDHEALIADKLDLARRLLAPGGRITMLTVLEGVPGYVSEFVTIKEENRLTDKIRDKLAQVIGPAEDIDRVVLHGKAGVEINAYARSHGCDMIVVGSRKPGMQDYFLGSTAARVARRAPCSVTVLRPADGQGG